MQRGNSVVVLVGLTLFSASGCATVVNGTTQKVGIGSNPPGAHVLIDNQTQVYTPASVDLSRSQSHTFYLTLRDLVSEIRSKIWKPQLLVVF